MSSGAEVRQRQRAGARAAAAGPTGSGPEPALSFALRFEAGHGLLALVRAPDAGPARLDILELGIPDLRFPFDVTGGATRFQSHRLVLRRALVRVDLDRMSQLLLPRLTSVGVRRLEIGPAGVLVGLSGGALVAFRLLVEPAARPGTSGARDLAFRVADVRAVGPLGMPAALAAARVTSGAIRALGSAARTASIHPTDGESRLVLADPLRALLKNLLCRHGWRLPSGGGARLRSVSIEGGRASLSFSAVDGDATDELGAPATVVGTDPAALCALEGLRLAGVADALLRGGDLAGARRALVDALEMDPGEQTLSLRLAELDAVDPARADSALCLCAELRPRDGDEGQDLVAAAARAIEATALEVLGQRGPAATALEALAEVDPDPRVRVGALLHAARLIEDLEPERAFTLLSRVDRLRPGDAEPAERLLGLALLLGRRADAERIFPRALATADTAPARAMLLVRLGEALLSRWGDPASARAHLERALRIEPSHPAALEALGRAVARLGQPARAVRVLARLADVLAAAGDRPGAARAHLAAADLLAGPLDDAMHAASRAREAAALDPTLASAHLLLGKLSVRLQRAEEAVVALERFDALASEGAQTIPTSQRFDALVSLSAVHIERRGDPLAALEVARRALSLSAAEPRALRLVEEALFVRRDFQALAEHHEAAGAIEPDRAVHHLRELARLLDEHLDDPIAAMDAVRRATELDAHDLAAHEQLARLADRLGQTTLLRRALERLATVRTGASGRADALARLAELLLEVADVREATAALTKAASLAPNDTTIAERLVDVRRRIGDPVALAESLRRLGEILAGRADRDRLHEIGVEAARAFTRAGRLADAAEALRSAIASLDPQTRVTDARWGRAMLQLAEIEERRGAYADARLAYAALREASMGTARSALAEARVAEHLGDDAAARSLYEGLVDGRDARAAETALERLLALHRRREDAVATAEVLERAAARTEDRVRRAELLYDAARVRHDPLGDAAGAERSLWELAELSPPHAAGLRLLASIVQARGDAEALARVYTRMLALQDDREARIDALRALGALYEGPLRDARQALRTWELLLVDDPDAEGPRLSLARAALDSGASSAAEEHYGRLAVVATTPAVRAESALRMGLLRRDAGDFAAAERHLGAALEAGQDPRSVLQALEDVLARLGRHADQARILEQRIQVGDPEEARDALRRLAHLYEGPLDDPARAASAIARLALADSGNVEPLLWLARVSEAAGDSSGRVDALHRAAALTTEGPRAAEILTDAAIAVGSDPGRRDRVIALLEEALDRDPACLRAARLLDTRLEEIGAHEARSRLLARVAEAAQDPDARADARLALAQVRLVALGDPRGALQDALAAATQRPAESATLAARIASEIDDPAVEAAALAALLEARRDAPAATLRDSRMRLATLLSGSLGVPARAIEELRAVLSAAPGDTEATTALTALLRAGDDPEALADHLLGAPDDAPDRAAVIEEAARALGRAAARAAHAGDADRAIGLLERSWSLAQDEAVAETLDALYSSTGRLGPRQQLLERRADRQPPGVQRELLGRLAGLLPEAEAGGLDARLAALGDSAAVDRQVERLRAAGDTGAVVTLLAQVAMSAPAGPGRVRALLAVADAADEAGDVEALEDALREAVLEDPSAAEPTDRLVTLRIARNDLAGATVVLAQAEGFTAEPTRKASLMFRRAELHTRAGDDDAAIDALSRALACDPEDPEVQASLEGAYRRAGRWPELVALLAARAEELPVGDARAELSMEVSLLLEERLRDLAGAARLALRAADAFGHPDARAAAASRAVDLSHAAGEPTLEAEALQRLAGVTTDDGRAADALVARATRLREAGDATGAEAALEAALGRRPDHARALLELGMARQAQGAIDQARSLLQRFVDAGGGTAPERHEAVRVIAHCARAQGDLDGARSALERWAQLSPEDPAPHAARAALELEGGDGPAALVAMDALVDRSQDPAARFHALLDRGRLWRDRLGEPGHAARDFLAAAVIEPSAPPDSSQPRRDREVAETALALAVEAESWQDAVRSASVLLERTQEPLRLRELHEVRARLRAQRLGDYAGAVEDLVAATRADAGPAADDLLAALVDAGLTAGRVDAAFEGLDALVSRPRSSVDRATLCVRVAQAAEQVGHLDRAKAAYRRALELGARAPGAIATQLVRLLDPQRERDELRSLLELQLATQNLEARDPEARAAVLRRLATLSLDANEDTSAERHLRALADIAPADPLAFEHLRRIYEHRGAWPALLELLRARVRLPAGPSELVGMLHDIGRLLQDKLGTEGEAADAYREVLRLDPNYVSTLDALADLCFRRADFVEADALYARLGERGSLPLDTLLVRRAECAERMGRATEAVVHYRSALASNPRNGRASEAFARLLALAGQLEEAIGELGRAVELCPPGEEERAAELRVLLGETLLKAGRPGEAEAPLRTAAAVLEGDAQPLLLLRDVYSHMGRWRDVIDVFSKLSYLVTTPRARAELEYRIGEVHRTRLGDPDAAAQHFARGYDIDPRHLPTLRRLVVRYAETARDRDALDVFVELWRLDAAAARRGDVLRHAACAAARLGEPEAVEAALAQTNREAPDQPGPLLAMARLAAGSDPERASASLRTALQLGAGADDLARLARELAGDPAVLPQARTAAQAALALRPADVQALSVLVDAARQMGDLAGAARAQGVLAFVDPSAAPPTFDAPRVLGEEEREAFLDPPGQSSLAIAIRHSRHAFRPGTGETTVPGIPIGPDGDPAVAEPLSQARLLVGGPDVEPYLLDDPSTGLALQGGEVPRLLFGGDFGELPEGERLWLVARSLIRVTTGEGLIERVDPAEILGRLRALRRALVGARVDDDARELLERSAAAMSASDRIVVAQALDRGLQDATPEMVARVVEALHLFANRAALVATRDVTSALTALARAENDGELPSTAAERAQIVQGSRALTDLVAFALTTPQ